MALSRKEFDERLADRNLTPEQKDFLRREYYKDAVKPSLKGKPGQHKRQVITDWGIVAPPTQQSARTRDHLLESVKENAVGGAVDFAKGAARAALDEGPTALVRRASGKAADVVYDAVAKPLGLPTSAEQDKATGRAPNRRLLPAKPQEERSAAEQIGGFVGQMADPINVVAPLNVFAKGAPAVKAGINLLPKAPPPSILQQALKGAAGAGATNAAIAGATSLTSQALDNQPIDPQRTLTDTALGFGAGALLGAPAAALPAWQAAQAAARGTRAAQVDAASGLTPAVTDPTVTNQILRTFENNRAMARSASEDFMRPSFEPEVAAPVQATPGPVIRPAPGVTPEARAAARLLAEQQAKGQRMGASAAADYLGGVDDAAPVAPVRAAAGPAPAPMTPGVTAAQREAIQAAQVQAEAEAARLARQARPLPESPYLDPPAPRLYDNPLLDTPAPVRAPAEPLPAAPRPYRATGAAPGTVPDSPFIEAPAPRLTGNPLMDVPPPAATAAEATVPAAAPPRTFARLLADESGQFDSQALIDDLAARLAKLRKDASPEGIQARMALAREVADALEASGRKRLAETSGRLYSTGMDPEVLLGHTEVLMGRLLREGVRKAEWAAEMVETFGDAIRPHLDAIWEQAVTRAREIAAKFHEDLSDPLTRYKAANQRSIDMYEQMKVNAKNPERYREARAAYEEAQAEIRASYEDLRRAGFATQNHTRKPEDIGEPIPRLDSEVDIFRTGTPRTITAEHADIAGTSLKKAGHSQRTARDLAAEREEWEATRLWDDVSGVGPITNKPKPSRGGVVGGTLKRLMSDESGEATVEGAFFLPRREDVSAAVDAGIDVADHAARVIRSVDSLIEQGIAATRADAVVRPLAGGVRRLKDAGKERLRTGVTGGRVEAADDLGRFFVSSKAPTPYQDLKDRIRSQTIRQMQGLTEEARRLDEAGIDQEALYDIVTDRNLNSTDAEAVRTLTGQVSRDLLDVGSLTPAQQAKWDGEYLPRSYADKDNAIAGLVKRARKTVTLAGNKRRGKVEELSPEALAVRQKPWREAGTAADGRVVLEDTATGETMLVARRNVGNFTANWSNLGAAKGGKVKAWRDWTPTEREAMGELKNVSHALRKIAATAYGDLNNGRLLKAVSENPEWAIRDADGLMPPESWVYIDKKVVKSNGVRKWGALADHWVEPSIAADLAAATNNDAIGQVVRILRTYTGINQWKKLKVVYNPASHGNQLMQNMITLEAAGGSVSDVPRAARMLRTEGDPLIAQFRELGLYGDDYLSTEGMTGAGSSDYLDWGAVAGIPRVAQSVDEAASSLYQFSDNMTRTAYVLGKLDEGVDMQQAIREAREKFYNGNTVNSGFARVGSASLLPFVKPAIYTIDRLPELIEANPVKAVKLLAYWMAFDQGFKAISGHLGDEEGRQALLPDYQKGVAKTIPLPITDTRGQQLLFDYQRMNPAGSAFGVNDRTGFGPVPEAFVPLGGPVGGMLQAILNKDAFKDRPLRTSTQNDTPGFLAGQFTPGFTGGIQRLLRAAQGIPEYTGGPTYDVPTALVGLMGLKVQPFSPELGYDQNAKKFIQERDDLLGAARRVASDLEGRRISQSEHDARMAELDRRLDDLANRFDTWDAQAQRGLEAFRGRAQ